MLQAEETVGQSPGGREYWVFEKREGVGARVVERPVDLDGVLVHPAVPTPGTWGLTTGKTRTGASLEVWWGVAPLAPSSACPRTPDTEATLSPGTLGSASCCGHENQPDFVQVDGK